MPSMKPKILLLVVLWFTMCAAGADDSATPVAASGNLVPAYLLELPGSVSDVLIADTSSATMHRFVRAGENIVPGDQRYMSIGLNGTGKQRAWDRKTPLGVYFVTERLDTSKLDDKYGVAAFPLDYPNAWDRFRERTGSGIWLHGVDHKNPQRPPRDTDGCLALPNEEILLLLDVLKPLVTPVIVARDLSWATADEIAATRREFRRVLDVWRRSQARGDLKTYLSMYADDFAYRQMDLAEWSSWRAAVFEARKLEDVQLDDVMLLADPEEVGLYLSRFKQVMVSEDGPVTTIKRHYWRRDGDNRWQIVSEDAG